MSSILVAGGTDGIGLALVKRLFLRNDAKIYVLGRKFEKLELFENPKLVKLKCDITDEQNLTKILNTIDDQLDLFVNTIGTFTKGSVRNLQKSTIEDSFNLNAVANIDLTCKILPKLNPNYAQIIVCLATLAKTPKKHLSLQSATKAAYRSFLISLREELSPNVRVSLILPASVQTDIFKKSGHEKNLSGLMHPEDLAELMYFVYSTPKSIIIPEIEVLNNN